MKKLMDYPKTPVRMHMGANVGNVVEYEVSIPAPVAAAHDAVVLAARERSTALCSGPMDRLECIGDRYPMRCEDCANLTLRDALAALAKAREAE